MLVPGVDSVSVGGFDTGRGGGTPPDLCRFLTRWVSRSPRQVAHEYRPYRDCGPDQAGLQGSFRERPGLSEELYAVSEDHDGRYRHDAE